MAKVSVIVPIYGAELYIERCVRSLFEQTLKDMEFILIDDCSPDRSIEILRFVLNDYPQRKNQVKIIKLPCNSKQAVARNNGLKYVSGEYVIHCDPDDWVDDIYYESLYKKAKSGNFDIVVSDYVLCGSNFTERVIVSKYKNPLEILENNKFYSFSLCNHLVKLSVVKGNNINFYEGINFMEDFGFLSRVFFFSKTIGYIDEAVYYYNKDNPESITKKLASVEIMEQRTQCVKLVEEFYRNQGFDPYKLGLLMRTKRDIRDTFLQQNKYKEWVKTFPEVSKWCLLNSDASLSYRILYYILSKCSYRLIKYVFSLKQLTKK